MRRLSLLSAAAALGACGLVFYAVPAEADAPQTAARDDTDKQVHKFEVGGKTVGVYQYGAKWAKPFLWPVVSPNGVPLTRDWPMKKATPDEKGDHPHQKSIWFCHGDVIPEGVELKAKVKGVTGVDFWAESPGHGTIVCTDAGRQLVKNGVVVGLETKNEWRTAEGVKILDETRFISLHTLPGAYLFVFDIDLFASVCPIIFGDTKEGSFGVRVNELINEVKGKGTLTTADGKVGEKGGVWGSTSAWCDYSGTVDGKTAGIAILCSPANPYPSYWHSRGYGLMAANPFGRKGAGFPAAKDKTELVKLAKGEHLKLRYGVLLHDGDVKAGKVAEHYETFAKMK